MEKRIHLNRFFAIILSLIPVTMGGYAQEEKKDFTPQSGQEGKDVVWVPTPQELVDSMLHLAKVTPSDYLIDLGSGDGRLVITAAKRGATALGIEYNINMVELARNAAKQEGVSEKAKFEKADIFETDFSKATVLTLFLLTELNLRLRPTILDMKPGTRVVANTFGMGEWEPDEVKVISIDSYWKTANLWIVPAKVDGTWKIDGGEINITQEFQQITGSMTIGGKETTLSGKLNGDKISFNAGGTQYTGTVSGNKMSGQRAGGNAWSASH